MTWESIKEAFAHSYVVGPVVFAVWCIIAFTLKAIIFKRLKKIADITTTRWDNIIINSVNTPLVMIIPFVGLSIVWKFVPMNTTFEYYMNLISIFVVIVSITLFIDRFARGLLGEHDRKTPSLRLSRGIIGGLIRGLIYAIALFILLDYLGVNISPLIASLGIGTLAVALALQSTLANFFSGLFVMMDRSISVGDFVQLETGEMGYVDEIGWRASRIRLLTHNHVIIPNSKLVDSVVTNFQAPDPMLFILVEVGVHYDSDLEHVERVVREVAKDVVENVKGAAKNHEPSVWFREFADSSINFRVRVGCVDFISQFEIQHELVKKIHKRFGEEGIVIPYPLRTLDIQPKHEEMLRELTGGKDKTE